ncbi:cilia- and flagella-associated protein 298 isoform X3 [Arctopsyche grandis]|uniref:cilia- and flagella-associated protein 298 isoform X3 n=1 Tax=Arctopsyche grandis TaxID=121162 RepID=UPI00406D7A15
MVVLVVKKGDDPQFLFETSINASVDDAVKACAQVHNGRLKVQRICYEAEELAKYGTMMPPEIVELLPEQAAELGLKDMWADRCAPHGWVKNLDPIGRRCGRQPPTKMQQVLTSAVENSREIISKKHCSAGSVLTQPDIARALNELKGAVAIVYPMGLPPHDPIRQELENREDLKGTQASLEVLDPATTVMWFCGKQMLSGNLLSVHLGKNDKCKVIVKLCRRGDGAPGREPVMSEEDRKQLMLHAYRRQEELKKLEQDDDDEYLDTTWADSGSLKRHFQGLDSITWRPK